MQTSENNKRIEKNSLYMSIRMIVVLFISLFYLQRLEVYIQNSDNTHTTYASCTFVIN